MKLGTTQWNWMESSKRWSDGRLVTRCPSLGDVKVAAPCNEAKGRPSPFGRSVARVRAGPGRREENNKSHRWIWRSTLRWRRHAQSNGTPASAFHHLRLSAMMAAILFFVPWVVAFECVVFFSSSSFVDCLPSSPSVSSIRSSFRFHGIEITLDARWLLRAFHRNPLRTYHCRSMRTRFSCGSTESLFFLFFPFFLFRSYFLKRPISLYWVLLIKKKFFFFKDLSQPAPYATLWLFVFPSFLLSFTDFGQLFVRSLACVCVCGLPGFTGFYWVFFLLLSVRDEATEQVAARACSKGKQKKEFLLWRFRVDENGINTWTCGGRHAAPSPRRFATGAAPQVTAARSSVTGFCRVSLIFLAFS